MSTNQKKVNISPVLFLTVDGEPMAFFLRPGPVKRKLQPLIKAGGGMLCNMQKPEAILLIEPRERGSVAGSTAHRFVSTQYVYDCVEKDEQLNLDDYRFKPEAVPQRQSARLNSAKGSSDGVSGGRMTFTNEDDAAILSYASKQPTKVRGNRLWREMEEKRVTGHSWQSMRDRYLRLAKKQLQAVEVAATEGGADTAEGEGEAEAVQETEGEKHVGVVGDGASTRTHSKEDLTQTDPQAVPAESVQSEVAEARISVCPQGEAEPVSPRTDEEPAERTEVETVEAETYATPQSEGSCSRLLTDLHPIPAENTELETDEPQTVLPPRTESAPEDPPTDQPASPSKTSSRAEPKEKVTASPSPERRGKKLRSSSPSPAKRRPPSPEPSNKTHSDLESALQKDQTVETPPSKKARGQSAAAVAESRQQEERAPAPISGTTQAVPRKEEKKNPTRKLGILEMATREFDDESEPDEGPDPRTSTETAPVKPAETEPRLPSPDGAASTESRPEPGPSPRRKNVRESGASGGRRLPTAGSAEPAAAAAAAETVDGATSEPHLFIFQSETQEEEEEDPRSAFGGNPAAAADPQPAGNRGDAFSLTQDQLEKDKKLIRELMRETNKGLVAVTKALLRTSGSFSDALDLLSDPSSLSGRRLWQCRDDDDLLLSADPGVRERLREKYGEELVAKRIAFLELEV